MQAYQRSTRGTAGKCGSAWSQSGHAKRRKRERADETLRAIKTAESVRTTDGVWQDLECQLSCVRIELSEAKMQIATMISELQVMQGVVRQICNRVTEYSACGSTRAVCVCSGCRAHI